MNRSLATLGPCGYLPAPGTIGSLVALPVAYYLGFLPDVLHIICIVFITFAAYQLIVAALPSFCPQ